MLAAICWHPKKPRTITDLKNLGEELGAIFEWAVAQEIWRRICISSADELPEHIYFWQSHDHEIDFILPEKNSYLEVKAGIANPTDFIWFLNTFHNRELTVINKKSFNTQKITGIPLEDFLLTT